jgi:hypothetical protein
MTMVMNDPMSMAPENQNSVVNLSRCDCQRKELGEPKVLLISLTIGVVIITRTVRSRERKGGERKGSMRTDDKESSGHFWSV